MSDKLTPYSVTQGKPYFDWHAFLARDPRTISSTEIFYAIDLAWKWPTCACGNQCSSIPRQPLDTPMEGGAPVDDDLLDLGTQFPRQLTSDIYGKSFEGSRNIMAKIEQRSAEILHEMARKSL